MQVKQDAIMSIRLAKIKAVKSKEWRGCGNGSSVHSEGSASSQVGDAQFPFSGCYEYLPRCSRRHKIALV